MTGPSEAKARLAATGRAIVDGVATHGAAYVCRRAAVVVDAWGRVLPAERARLDARVAAAAADGTERVVRELEALVAEPAPRQRATPLEVVRTIGREATAVLTDAGIPPVRRDAFDERSWPDDCYGFVPHRLDDLGADDLGPLQLAWGLAKAQVVRAGGS